MISLKDLYWAAGFTEGEGSFNCCGGHLELQVAQVHKPPVERLKDLFGGNLRQQIKRDKPHWQPSWHWRVTGERAAGIMMTVYSLMSPKRKGQIEKALRGWYAVPIAPRKRTQCPRGHKYDENNTYRKADGSRECIRCRRINARLGMRKSRAKGKGVSDSHGGLFA